MTNRPLWQVEPIIDWDETNEGHVYRHGVGSWEIDDMILMGEYVCVRHPKWRDGGKYAKRYLLQGHTSAGRELLVIVDKIGANKIRPVTAW